MAGKSSAVQATADREIIISRVLDAPRELVFRAWTDPQHVVHWWGPKGFTTTIHEMDVRPGGVWRHTMHGPDGTDYPNESVFIEVVKPERIVYSHGGGKAGDPGAQFQATWTFEAQGDKTKLTLRMVFPSAADRDRVVKVYGAIEGANQTLGRLEQHLPMVGSASEEFSLSRVFDAPRDLVFKAWTESERLTLWWGPKGFKMLVAKLDLRPGGVFHYCMQAPEGSAMGHNMWGKFVYREIDPPRRLVFVNSFSDEAGGLTRHPMAPNWPLEVLNVLTFAEHQRKTTVTLTGIPINVTEAEREVFKDGHKSMLEGLKGVLDQLRQYLAEVRI